WPGACRSTGYSSGEVVESGDGCWRGSSPAQPATRKSKPSEKRRVRRILLLPFRSAPGAGRAAPFRSILRRRFIPDHALDLREHVHGLERRKLLDLETPQPHECGVLRWKQRELLARRAAEIGRAHV